VARYQQQTDGNPVATPPVWGTLTEEQLETAALMEAPDGLRVYVLPNRVEKREKQGWKRVEEIVPNLPPAAAEAVSPKASPFKKKGKKK
jgi:hypothetical protein